MKTFEQSYQKLNAAQRQAVDTIEGPVMVVAGPGTGKTQLLSMRAANILRQTDVLPNNILCLTFTDSAAVAMRERLALLMGPEGYKIAVHTFHSFGTEIINRYPEYSYKGADFRPADELTSYELLEGIFRELPHKNPLATTMNGEFTFLRDTQAAIGYLKKAGLSPEELLQIIDSNDEFIEFAEPSLAAAFDVPRFSKKDVPACERAAAHLDTFVPTKPSDRAKPLSEVCTHELYQALREAAALNTTTPVVAWRTKWLERDVRKRYVFKDRTLNPRLRAVAELYHIYQHRMRERQLFDFDDMIINVVQALEHSPELRYNLQEQYLYIMVDEFQDTNGAQLRLLQNLCDSEVTNGRPDIMVVGDDDQGIYAFQGAELNNIVQFKDMYQDVTIVELTENYRSTHTILQSAEDVIGQGKDRLATRMTSMEKKLHANYTSHQTMSALHEFTTPAAQAVWVTTEVKRLIQQGIVSSEIAILARNHRQLLELVPFLYQADIPIDYERRNNVLEMEHIQVLTTLARIVVSLGEQQFDTVDGLLPELLSYPMWQLSTDQVWQLSLAAYKQHRFWLELMLEMPGTKLHEIAEFLIVTSHLALHAPLEPVLDVLVGSSELQAPELTNSDATESGPGPIEEFVSPLRAYYFNAANLEHEPVAYLSNLSALATIRRKLREYQPDQVLMLSDFIEFIELHQKAGLGIVDTGEQRNGNTSVKLMTAHKAKGLEFDVVFVLSCQEDIWSTAARHHGSAINFPHNLEIEPAGQSTDDCLRLFFVAATRARHTLYCCSYQTDSNGKSSALAGFLANSPMAYILHDETPSQATQVQMLRADWQTRHLPHTIEGDWRELLRPQLSNYQLSATHLNNFLDVSIGGPQAFLLQNLLRFPQAMSSNAIFGSAIHATLRRAHVHLAQTGEHRPTEDILHDFELQLQLAHLGTQEQLRLIEKGSAILTQYLLNSHDRFTPTQKAEYSLRNVQLGEMRLAGTLDLIDIDESSHTIVVTDYKTGRAPAGWQGRHDYEKIKLHRYRQQLLFYKLLIENSQDFSGKFTVERACLEFIEADNDGMQHLELAFDTTEIDRFIQLLNVVWQHITLLGLPDISVYAPNYSGLLSFENDLLAGKA